MANEKKKYKVLCWGDCKKFPELGDKCYLSFAHRPERVYEGDVTDIIPAQSVPWLKRDGFIEDAPQENEQGGEQ
jgi:hypothetical protein